MNQQIFKIIGDGAFAKAMHAMLSSHNARVVSDFAEPVEAVDITDVDWVIPCVPAYVLEDVLKDVSRDKKILIISKGMSGERTPCELMEEMGFRYAVLAGPHFAHEIVDGLYTETSIACDDADWEYLKDVFHNVQRFPSKKILQFAGVMKNMIAYMAGWMHGMGLGKNATACMIVNAIKEFYILCQEIFPDEKIAYYDLLSPGVLGDVILSASSNESRNFKCGYNKAIKQPMDNSTTVEAVNSAKYLVNRVANDAQWSTIYWILQNVVANILDSSKCCSQYTGFFKML